MMPLDFASPHIIQSLVQWYVRRLVVPRLPLWFNPAAVPSEGCSARTGP